MPCSWSNQADFDEPIVNRPPSPPPLRDTVEWQLPDLHNESLCQKRSAEEEKKKIKEILINLGRAVLFF